MPLVQGQQSQGFLFALALTGDHLELRTLGEKSRGPVYSSLCDGDIRRRIQGGRRQPLARACGLHRDGAQRILDATAGLGRDGVVLAGLGCEVTLVERSPVVAALLRDGLARAVLNDDFGAWLKQRTQFLETDAITLMQTQRPTPHDVVYLDPMYPQRGKRALAKKEMRVLRAVAGDDADNGLLLESALGYAGKRVVVKRPPWAESLVGREPDHQLSGNRARFDVYFTQKAVR